MPKIVHPSIPTINNCLTVVTPSRHGAHDHRCLTDLHQIFCPPRRPAHYYYYGDHNRAGSSPSLSGEERPVCEALLRTNLFAAVSPRREHHPGVPSDGGDDDNDDGVNDLSRISRWALAVRAPTLAEFFSADVLLVPGKAWDWLANEDVLER